ncbi:MAG: helix-hairpin-helix domain-containing protein [Bacteroidales bacterium]|nr:helix-hairpin-helix domain-containing protein [Bacteroidales bacterium]
MNSGWSRSSGSNSQSQQRRGLLWLALLVFLTVSAFILFPRGVSHRPPVADSLSRAVAMAVVDSAQATRRHYSRTYSRPGYAEASAHAATALPPVKQERRCFYLEVNSADTLDWQQLYGIGHTFSNRIVSYRQRLGGFYALEQLREVYGITDSLYLSILPHLRLDTTLIRPLKINTATIDSLKRHPYLDYYQAKAIVRYRERYGAYGSADDLLQVNLIDQSTLNKIKPYLSF